MLVHVGPYGVLEHQTVLFVDDPLSALDIETERLGTCCSDL